ncbi:MAG: HEAT repeat domain-containing protein [Planctomycetota bacterium]
MRPIHLPTAAVLALGGVGALASADVVELEGGGRIRGEVVRDGSLPRNQLPVETPWGSVVLDRGRVERLAVESPAEAEYLRRAPTVSDTIAGHHAFALWCRDNGLGDAMRRHLSRVLELDPNHEASRTLLGYQRVGDAWLNREERLAARGLVRHEGEYRTQQEIELLDRKSAVDARVREWKRRLEKLREQLGDPDREQSRAAAEVLLTLGDALAAEPLAEWLGEETDRRVRQLLIEATGALPGGATLGVLVGLALEDDDPEARALAIEQLATSRAEGLATPFVAALASKNNETINRAADALASLGGPGELSPLIDALVTTHKFRTGPDSGETYSFNPGSGQFSFGGGPRVRSLDANNPRVLAALTELTDANFGFDEKRWRAWLATQQVAAQVDLRRDP